MYYFTNNIILPWETIIIQNINFFVVFGVLFYFVPLIIGPWQASVDWGKKAYPSELIPFFFDESSINCTCSFTIRKRISRLSEG